jgi:putative ABC transport system permease protein
MLLNYLSIAWRSLRKNPLYSFINISGLSAGLCVCMLILLYVAHEHSYDRFHKNADRIFRINGSLIMGTQTINFQGVSFPSGPLVKETDPRVTDYLRIKTVDQPVPIQNKEYPARLFAEKKWIFTDPDFFSFFTFPLISGNPAAVLQRANTVVLSERVAKKYFGIQDPIGRLLQYNHKYTLEVTGVAKDPPSNSSIDFDFIASLSSLSSMEEYTDEVKAQGVGFGGVNTYVRISHPEAARGVEKTLDLLGAATDEGAFSHPDFHLDAFTGIHLGLNFGDFTNIKYLSIFPLVAGLVLLLALINYMSLATARATARAGEIGVRKTMGAGRRAIAFQFYVESTLYAVLAFSLGWGLFFLLKPGFLNLLHLAIDDSFLMTPGILALFGGLLLLTIGVAGSYPALVLSSFNPVETLSGKVSKQRGGALVRKTFTVGQFTISVALVICSLIMNRQLFLFRHMDTGLNRENVVMIPFSRDMGAHYNAFKQGLSALPGITRIATTHFPIYGTVNISMVTQAGKGSPIPLDILDADSAFIPTAGIRWRFPPRDLTQLTTPHHIVINESAIGELHLSANPIGETIEMDDAKYIVSGVVRDFNYFDLNGKIRGLGLVEDTLHLNNKPNPGCLYVKTAPHINMPSLMESIQKIHDRYDTGTPFEYQFMDDAFDNMFKAEDRLADLIGVFTALTIGIACLGLFGLAAFSAAQRTREIGVRKVLGAGIYQIVRLLTVEFLLLVGLAIAISVPVAWWVMDHWLERFTYRVSISPWVFVSAGLGALLIAILTVSSQALKAAMGNPVKSLRTE